MKLKKEDYMRLPKERLAELLAEMDDVKVDPIVIPAPPVTTPNDPWKPYPYPYGPIITYTDTKPLDHLSYFVANKDRKKEEEQ